MKSFKNLFTKYLTEQPAPAAPPKEAPPKEKPDTKPTTEPKTPRRNPLEPRPGFQPRPKGLVPKGTEEEEENKKLNKNPDVQLFFKYRNNIGRT
jgi:hypothetical protein